jgi:hypothetical protein
MKIPFHGEVASADATLGVEFTLYLDGSGVAHTLAANQWVVMTDYSISPEVAMQVKITHATDAAGLRPVNRYCAATGGADRPLSTPYKFPVAVVPKLFGSVADHIAATIHGFIVGP